MPKLVVLLSGRICTGKTTLANQLVKRYGFRRFSSRETMQRQKERAPTDRRGLQNFGDELDRKTRGAWLRDELEKEIRATPADIGVIIDSVRIQDQIDRFRESYRPLIVHVHLDCSDEELASRYKKRGSTNVKELASFAQTVENKTEASVRQLKGDADIAIRTDHSTQEDILVRVACLIGLHGREQVPTVDAVVGGQYGSEGKGQVAAYLAPKYDLLVRVGGPNAGHKVFEDGGEYTFHQLPSGTRCSRAKLLIGPGAVIGLDVLLKEIAECKVDYKRLSIDPQAIIITEADIEKEKERLARTIGSTAKGVGAATIRRIERRPKTLFAGEEPTLERYIRPALQVLEDARINRKRILLEGTQGTGLSLFHGSYPHVTSRDTTVAGCMAESGIPPRALRKTVMVCRTFPIRVESPPGGDSGPLPREISYAELSRRSGISVEKLKRTEKTSTTNKQRRLSEFGWELLRKSAALNAPTDIAVTFVDYLDLKNRDVRRFDQLTADTQMFIEEIERVANAPVSLASVGFGHRAVLDRRSW
jgi:adenylosuccinate synthase